MKKIKIESGTYPRREGHWAEEVGQSVQWSEVERWIAHRPMDKEMENLFLRKFFRFLLREGW